MSAPRLSEPNVQTPMRLMLSSYDALGLGHIRRMMAIARAVLNSRRDVNALLTTCSPLVDSLPTPPGLDVIKLPSLRKLENGRYVSRSLHMEPQQLFSLRADIMRMTAGYFDPDLLVVDKSPRGPMSELTPMLEARRATPTRMVLGWRDILDGPDQVHSEWRDGRSLEAIARYYDEIWVYGDPRIFDVRDSYELPDEIAEHVRYMGYLAPRVDADASRQARTSLGAEDRPLAVVTCGGGEDGEALVSCYVEAARRGLLPDDLKSVIVTGPLMSEDAQQRLRAQAPKGVLVRRFIPGLEATIAAADVVVGMAGYNTVCEILGAGRRSVLVPRIHTRREQSIRASRLGALGLARPLDPESLSPAKLAAATRDELAQRPHTGGVPMLDGLRQVAERVGQLFPSRLRPVSPAPVAAV